MPRTHMALAEVETAIIEQMASVTRTKSSDVIKNALAVYQWFVRQAMTGAQVVARKPSGEEVTLETAELARLEGQGQLLDPHELKLLARQLGKAKDASEAARLREQLTRGFYGI